MKRRNTNDAILAKLDKLIEQVKLTNALLAGPTLFNENKMFIHTEWKDAKNESEGDREAPGKQKEEDLTVLRVFRIAEDEAR